MSFLDAPQHLNKGLDDRGLLEDIYEALRTMDMGGAVMCILRVLRNTGNFPPIENKIKSPDQAVTYCKRGNDCTHNQQYRSALGYYNKALLYAPKDSKELLLAYGNRAILLFKLEAYSASIKDVDICFKLKCTDTDCKMLKRLADMKTKCEKLIWKEYEKRPKTNSFMKQFFKIKGKTHPDVPCLSAQVDLVPESGEMKAVAVADITVGTVLAVETAFATYSRGDKSDYACHYCQNLTLNLLPCDNCCYALFCSKKCKKLCIKEYHLIECQIMDILRETDNGGSRLRLAVKTVLKLKSLCKQWSTLIIESQNIGPDRLKTSSVNEVYDVTNYSSILSFNDDRHFVHGTLYNSCFMYAAVIHHLQNIDGFFPADRKECFEAQKCLAKLFTTFDLLWPCTTEIENMTLELVDNLIVNDLPHHYGCFAFTSKLKHYCEPNVLVLGLDNQVGLVAMQPIKKNSEIRISYLGHWAQHVFRGHERTERIYRNTFSVCTCLVCKEGWGSDNARKGHYNYFQRLTYRHWANLELNSPFAYVDELYFKETCKTLTALSKQPHTKEYCHVFTLFLIQLNSCQLVVSKNYLVTDGSPK